MSSSSSSSDSRSSNTTVNEDSRISADNGATVLGKGAQLTISDQFSPQVSQAFTELVQLARDTINGASAVVQATTTKSLDQATQQTAGATNAINDAYARATAGPSSVYTDLFPMVALVAVGVLVVVLLKKK